MEFKDNFTTTNLLFAQPVTFNIYTDKEHMLIPVGTFQMQIPTYKMLTFNEDFKHFVGLINTPLSDLQKQFEQLATFSSLYGLFLHFGVLPNKYSTFYFQLAQKALLALDVDLQIHKGSLIINNIIIDEQLFTRITRIILLATALKKQSDFVDDPRLQEYQDKINRIKNKNQSKVVSNFEQSFMILTYEFNYKPEEVLNMTPYLINTILSYTGKSIRYKTTLIAAGNGNTKKVKFITDKGK